MLDLYPVWIGLAEAVVNRGKCLSFQMGIFFVVEIFFAAEPIGKQNVLMT